LCAEALHYSRELGERILGRIYDYEDESRVIPDDFWILLTENNKLNMRHCIKMERKFGLIELKKLR